MRTAITRTRWLALFPCLLCAALAHAHAASNAQQGSLVTVRFELKPVAALTIPPQGRLRLRPVSAPGELVFVAVEPDRDLTAQLPPRTTWELDGELASLWTPRKVFTTAAPGGSSQETLRLWPTAALEGSLRVPGSGELPKTLGLEFDSAPQPGKPREIARAAVACKIGELGRFRCAPPAAVLDLILRVDGFVPHYRWSAALRHDRPTDLGALELRPGASVAGRVEVSGGAVALGKCTARLAPLLAAGTTEVGVTEQLRKVTFDAQVNQGGFFQIGGVPPGTYVLEVSQPGFSAAKAYPIEVWPGAETCLKQALVLEPPLDIEFTIHPSLDWAQQPWRVTINRHSDFSASVDRTPAFEGVADAGGKVRLRDQAPGRFWAMVADSQGNRLLSQREIAITSQDSAAVDLEIALTWVEGTVTYRDGPIAATLHFGGRHGAVSVAMEADEEGEFRGALPNAGTWRVDVGATDPPLTTHCEVEVDPNDRGLARVRIRLPDTQVFGSVLDALGQPIPKAAVRVSSPMAVVQEETEKDGAFDVRAMPEGRVEITAEAATGEGRLTSEPLLVELRDQAPVGPVILTLQATKTFRGQVRSPRGPVAGAAVMVSTLSPPSSSIQAARTDLEGSFAVRIPGRSQRLAITVSPPGHALTTFEVPVGPEPPLLQVGEEAGDLEVAAPYTVQEFQNGKATVIFQQNGLPLPVTSLFRWAAGHGVQFQDDSGFHVPRLAPGEYRVCLGPREMVNEAEFAAWLAERARCQSGYLAPAAQLRLQLAAPEAEEGSP